MGDADVCDLTLGLLSPTEHQVGTQILSQGPNLGRNSFRSAYPNGQIFADLVKCPYCFD